MGKGLVIPSLAFKVISGFAWNSCVPRCQGYPVSAASSGTLSAVKQDSPRKFLDGRDLSEVIMLGSLTYSEFPKAENCRDWRIPAKTMDHEQTPRPQKSVSPPYTGQ